MSDVDLDVDSDESETLVAAKAAKEAEIQARLSKVADQSEAAQSLARIVMDPDVAAVLRAKQAGRKVKVEELTDEGNKPSDEAPPPDEPFDYDTADNKALAKHILDSVARVVGQSLDTKLQPLSLKLQGLEADFTQRQTLSVQDQIQRAEKKFTDFKLFSQDMIQVHQSNPGLSVEELYYMAKMRKGGLEALTARTESERPGSSASKPVPTRKVPLPPGRRGFDQLLAEALEKSSKLDEIGEEV